MEPNKDLVEEMSEELGEQLAARLTLWLEKGEDLTFSSWQRLLSSELKQPLLDYLMGPYSNSLKRRGIEPLDELAAMAIVDKALFDARDIYATLMSAPYRVESVTAGFFVDTLLRRVHQSKVVNSLLHRVRDLFGLGAVEEEIAKPNSGFTGRKMWRTNVASSRHIHLNGVIKQGGELFEVAPNMFWPGPRANIFSVAQSSGCRCELVFEYIDEDGNISWR